MKTPNVIIVLNDDIRLFQRIFIVIMLFAVAAIFSPLQAADTDKAKPNVVIVVADDLGWRDVSYQGSPYAKTPNLDDLATHGVRFDYFYSSQQMCAPGRFSILTGRSPFRSGIINIKPIRPQEVTIAKALKTVGYRTGHFGKWHLGDKPNDPSHPMRMGFDCSYFAPGIFDTGAKLTVNDTAETIECTGDSSVFTMNLALDWIRSSAAAGDPFFAYVCFGSPHTPHIGAPEFKALYKNPGKGFFQHDFLAEVSGIDAAVGNLRAELRKLGVADNTIVWFMSDNGGITPESLDPARLGKMNIGARTAACLEWPARITQPIQTSMVCVHMDIYPTLLDIVGVQMPNQPVLDGISLIPLFEGKMRERPTPIGSLLWESAKGGVFDKTDFTRDLRSVWIEGAYKLIVVPPLQPGQTIKSMGIFTPIPKPSSDEGVYLYDIYADPEEKTNLADQQPERIARMRKALNQWQVSVRNSYDGGDGIPKPK